VPDDELGDLVVGVDQARGAIVAGRRRAGRWARRWASTVIGDVALAEGAEVIE
jgi:hypothetical protein